MKLTNASKGHRKCCRPSIFPYPIIEIDFIYEVTRILNNLRIANVSSFIGKHPTRRREGLIMHEKKTW